MGLAIFVYGESMSISAERILEFVYEVVKQIQVTQTSDGAGGDASAANQVIGNESLSSIDTKLTSQSTAANQTTGNASLSSIDTKLTSQATAVNQATQITLLGSVTETAPATDTASSGLNGRLQRIAQNISTYITSFQSLIGSLTETAPVSDTGSSGLNGRLQRACATLTSLLSGLGATNHGVATTDTGTASLVSLIKRVLSKQSMMFSEAVIATTATTYASGDVIGAIVTLSSVNVAGDTVARLESLSISEEGGQAPALTFIIFRETPAGGTYTNDSTVVWNASDMTRRVGMVKVLASDWDVEQGKSMANLGNIDQIVLSLNTNYFVLCIANGIYISTSTNQITAKFGFSRTS